VRGRKSWLLRGDRYLGSRVRFELVAWDHPGQGVAMEAGITPQQAIAQGLPLPAECDLVLVVFWSRIGTPLPADFETKPDGTPYLDDFDHWVKESLRCPAYLRYVDDMVLLDDDKSRLTEWREAIQERLAQERLMLHPRKANIYQTRRGVGLLGFTVFPDFRRLRGENGYRFRRRLRGMARAYGQGLIDWKTIDPSVKAWNGHAVQADTLGLRRKLFAAVCCMRGSGP
jgi:hypothetical protein